MIEGQNIKFDEFEIDLLKNGLVREKIDYFDIEHAIISRQRLQKIWMLPFLIGILIFFIGILWFVKFTSQFDWEMMFHPNVYKPIFLQLISPLIFGILGGMIMYSSSKRDWILIITEKGKKTKRINIADIYKKGKLDELKKFLNL